MLYLSAPGANQILRFDGSTGASANPFVTGGSGGLRAPSGLVLGPDGNLYVSYVSCEANNEILEYNGKTGAFIKDFVTTDSGGLFNPIGLAFSPDGAPTFSSPAITTTGCWSTMAQPAPSSAPSPAVPAACNILPASFSDLTETCSLQRIQQ